MGVDVTPLTVQLPYNSHFIRHDVLAWDTAFVEAVGTGFDAVLSDMAPSTTGSKFVDAQKSLELSEAALAISRDQTSRAIQTSSRGVFIGSPG